MDMAGLAGVIRLFAKACRGETFLETEVEEGNMRRCGRIPLAQSSDGDGHGDEEDGAFQQQRLEEYTATTIPTVPNPELESESTLEWAYLVFPASSLSTLKSLAMDSLPPSPVEKEEEEEEEKEKEKEKGRFKFISTDDTLSALIWQAIVRARTRTRVSPPTTCPLTSTSKSTILGSDSDPGRGRDTTEAAAATTTTTTTTLSRNVDIRRFFALPPSYPGFMTSSTTHSFPVEKLLAMSLGEIAFYLRDALTPRDLQAEAITRASRIQRGVTRARAGTSIGAAGGNKNINAIPTSTSTSTSTSTAKRTPPLEIRLSSWAKEGELSTLDFGSGSGLGRPDAVRRPSFTAGAREGLVYFLPRAADGSIVVGVCLRAGDMQWLRGDEAIARFGAYIG
ncbi:uncharacterized protein BJX67DRAFT_386187 [Aspergillus lucknowensis]|uniref:Uncharacterized protein n=1 Tax=Aspergillus lucknowensis TaxID=176173 RepID=A0ABR4L8T9_9EURO